MQAACNGADCSGPVSAHVTGSSRDPDRDTAGRPAQAQATRYRRVLVVLEDDEFAQSAVVEGIELARVAHADVVFLQLLVELQTPPIDVAGIVHMRGQHLQRASQMASERRAAAAMRAASKAGVPAKVASGWVARSGAGIAAAAEELSCDLIVVATDGHNAVARLLMGSVIPGLVTAATASVMVCRGGSAPSIGGRRRRRAGRAATGVSPTESPTDKADLRSDPSVPSP